MFSLKNLIFLGYSMTLNKKTENILSLLEKASHLYANLTFKIIKEDYIKNRQILCWLLNKINSNLEAASLLLRRNYPHEIKIILRSAFETIVLMSYILEKPENETFYKNDSIMLLFKNKFQIYKNIVHYKKSSKKLLEHNKAEFLLSFKKVKDIALKYLGEDICSKLSKGEIDEKSLEKKLRTMPKSMKTGTLLNNLKTDLETESLKKYGFELYDSLSQTAHGALFSWMDKPNINSDIKSLHSYFLKIIFLSLITLRKAGVKSDDYHEQAELRKIFETLQTLIEKN